MLRRRRTGKVVDVVLDASRFPRASAYLRALPAGFDSFPSCRVRSEVFEHIAVDFPELAEPVKAEPLASLLSRRLGSGTWLPEVVGQAANLMVRDACFTSDAEHHDWTRRQSAALFDKPLLRHLMRLVSPTLLVMGSARRWTALHEGSKLEARPVHSSGGRSETTARLTYPAGLFPPLFVEGLVGAFSAALSMARGRDVNIVLQERSDTFAEYRVDWST